MTSQFRGFPPLHFWIVKCIIICAAYFSVKVLKLPWNYIFILLFPQKTAFIVKITCLGGWTSQWHCQGWNWGGGSVPSYFNLNLVARARDPLWEEYRGLWV